MFTAILIVGCCLTAAAISFFIVVLWADHRRAKAMEREGWRIIARLYNTSVHVYGSEERPARLARVAPGNPTVRQAQQRPPQRPSLPIARTGDSSPAEEISR